MPPESQPQPQDAPPSPRPRPLAPLHLTLILALLTAPALAAQPARTVDLATLSTESGTLLRVYGAHGTGLFGVPVAGGGDVDGDGLADYAVAHMTASPLDRELAGEVDLVFGTGTIRGTLDTAVASPSFLRLWGAGEHEVAGSEIWMDDVTGDGLADLLICRQNFSRHQGRTGAGALTILAGGPELRARAATLEAVDLAAPPPELTLTTLVGAAALDRLCVWVRTGDVTGDGVADVAVGADQEDLPGEPNRGAVWVVRGGPHLATGGLVDLAGFGSTALAGHLAKLTPPAGSAGFHLGATCQIADLDGNGRGEVLAAAALGRSGAGIDPPGAPDTAESSGGAPDGTLFIAWDDNFPAGPWPAGFTFDLSDAPGSRTIVNGEDLNERFGEEILGGLDYDLDGRADLFVGDLSAEARAGFGHVFFDARELKGRVFDLENPPRRLRITRIRGPSDFALGADTAAHGDFNGDGIADLAFASPLADPQGRLNAGTVHLFFGREGGWPALIDTRPGRLPPDDRLCTAVIEGARGRPSDTEEGDVLGYSATAADVDGDALTDLIINEMAGDGLAPEAVDVGNLLVLSGALFIDRAVLGPAALPGAAGLVPRRLVPRVPPAARRLPACAGLRRP